MRHFNFCSVLFYKRNINKTSFAHKHAEYEMVVQRKQELLIKKIKIIKS